MLLRSWKSISGLDRVHSFPKCSGVSCTPRLLSSGSYSSPSQFGGIALPQLRKNVFPVTKRSFFNSTTLLAQAKSSQNADPLLNSIFSIKSLSERIVKDSVEYEEQPDVRKELTVEELTKPKRSRRKKLLLESEEENAESETSSEASAAENSENTSEAKDEETKPKKKEKEEKEPKEKKKKLSKKQELELRNIKDILHVENDPRPHTVLIDGYQVFFKTHFGQRHMQRGAVFAFTKTLLKMLEELKPYDNIALCSDSPGRRTHRDKLYQDFRIGRPARLPNEMVPQFCDLPIVCRAASLSLIRVLGWESDDIISTFAKKATAAGHRVTVVTMDKDLSFVVNENVSVLDYSKKQLTKLVDVKARFGGIEPELLPQVQAICGDNGDRIMGISGVGEKTAASLIKQYGSLEELLKAEDEGNKISAIQANADTIRKNFELLTVKDDLELNLEDIVHKPIVEEDLLKYLTNYGFNSIVAQWHRDHPKAPPPRDSEVEEYTRLLQQQAAQLEAAGDEAKAAVLRQQMAPSSSENKVLTHVDFLRCRPEGVTLVRDKETARKVLAKLRTLTVRFHACDTETIEMDMNKSAVGQGKVVCASIFCGPDIDFGTGPRIWIDNLDQCEGLLNEFKEYFEDENIKKVWHNYGFDKHVLGNNGVQVKGFGGDTMQMARLWDSGRTGMGGYSLVGLTTDLKLDVNVKRSIKERFGQYKPRKDGTPGKVLMFPKIEELQRNLESIHDWIDYSTFDAESTWHIRRELERLLKEMIWVEKLTMWDYYWREWREFGEVLTELEEEGIKIDLNHLKQIQEVASKDYENNKRDFLNWAQQHCSDAVHMNIESDAQKQQFLFAPYLNRRSGKKLEKSRVFTVDFEENVEEDGEKTKLKRKKAFTLDGLGIPPIEVTDSGWPAVSAKVIKHLAGEVEDEKWGTAFSFFKGGQEGKDACVALDQLLESGSIQTLLSTFIVPLQTMLDDRGRIHTSINVNTETGRLSSRRPNLQNQPALEKDRYKIRHAFTCEPGNSLIVADYGQLELRLLAHMTQCKSMIDAFHKGGDFHSRTVLGMYPEVQQAVDRGEVLLEWDYSKGKPPVPLLKEKYSIERRKAKTLNFSIAYGKTAVGLSKDWGVSLKEAEETLERWYNDRPEVRDWQQRTIEFARETGFTRTLLGRYRRLTDINSIQRPLRSHAERAAINTPLQGGAADVVIRAMVQLWKSEKLKELGWKQILQIHDEIILEGPQEHAQEALAIVKNVMRNPLDKPLLVDLDIDAKIGTTWYEAKG